MKSVVVKAGGNVLYPRATNRVDREFLGALYLFLQGFLLQWYDRVVLVPGGIGGELFIKWGREEGCTEAELDQIGCSLIGMSAAILNRALLANCEEGKIVCPSPPTDLGSLSRALAQYRLITVGCAIPQALTSDSLAASIAEHASADLKLLKAARPFGGEESFYLNTDQKAISLSKLIQFENSTERVARAGHHPSIDCFCLRIIRRAKLNVTIVLKEEIASWKSGEGISEIEIVHDC
jgi:uridylate kinase